ncbi:MAG: serine/threonine-protein kinase [Nannocystaceae bacterium]|nr:serine/threonine-protein kinase [Nannocystaceae bacterium]
MVSDGTDARGSGTQDESRAEAELVRRRPMQLERGRTIGRYVVLYELGSGGMGVVYAAYDPELDRKIALKLLHADSTSTRGRQRLMREAKAIAKLSHLNVVTVHDVGQFEGRVFVAMEFVDGVTLRQWLRERTRAWTDVLEVLCAAGEGLAAAHAADLVHRDFKPDNVLVDRNGRVIVLDFGLARRAPSHDDSSSGSSRRNSGESSRRGHDDDDDEQAAAPPSGTSSELDVELTRTGALLGTPAYMAPEQHLGNPVDARSDQFSFCVVLWESLYGARPFRGETATTTAMNVVKGLLDEPPRGSKVPSWLRRVLQRGLATEPAARHPDMRALLAELRRDRTRRTRRRLISATAGLGVAAGVAGAYVLATREPAMCTSAPERLAGVWDDGVRAQVKTAFEASGALYAATAFTGIEQSLDGYAARWVQQHREACEATHVHGEQSQELLDLRMGCLRGRLRELGALTEEFAHADAMVVEHAVEAAAGLGRLERCTEPQAASLRGPVDDASRERVDGLRERLADAGAKEAAGRYEAAQALAQDVNDRAGVIGFPPLVAEAHLRLGSVLEKRGDFEAAERELLEAVWQAEACRHETVAADAWVRLLWVTGVERNDVRTGELWSHFADAAVERAGNDELVRATLMHNRGGLRYRQGRYDEAFALYRDALEAQQRLLGNDDPQVAMTLNHIGNVKIMEGDLETAREYVTRSLDVRRRLLGDRHPKVAASINNLAAIEEAAGHPAAAMELVEQALAIVGGSGGAEEQVSLTVAVSAARRLQAPLDQRAAQLERLLVLRERNLATAPGQLAEAQRWLAEVRQAQGRTDDAVALLEAAIALQREPWPKAAIATLGSLEQLLRDAGRVAEADAAKQRARALEVAVAPKP